MCLHNEIVRIDISSNVIKYNYIYVLLEQKYEV